MSLVRRLLRRLQFKQRLLIDQCGHCRREATALLGCGSHVICRRCGDYSPHYVTRWEHTDWRNRHQCRRLFEDPRTGRTREERR